MLPSWSHVNRVSCESIRSYAQSKERGNGRKSQIPMQRNLGDDKWSLSYHSRSMEVRGTNVNVSRKAPLAKVKKKMCP